VANPFLLFRYGYGHEKSIIHGYGAGRSVYPRGKVLKAIGARSNDESPDRCPREPAII